MTGGAYRLSQALMLLLAIPAVPAQEQSSPQSAKSPLPEIRSLLAQVPDHQDELDRIRENYTYQEIVSTTELDKHGTAKKKTSGTYEVTFYKHRPIRRLTQVNESPLSPEKQAKEDARAQKLIKELDEGKAGKDPDENRRMRIAVLLRAERFKNPRREQYRGRDVVVFDFDPDPAFHPQNSYETFYKKMAGTMSVDEADLEVARVEFSLIADFKVGGAMFFDMKKGAHFVSEQGRFFDQIWLPTYTEVRFGARAIMFYQFGIDEVTSFGSYRRFNVTTEEKPQPPASKPAPDHP
jgi:hypothetical protein